MGHTMRGFSHTRRGVNFKGVDGFKVRSRVYPIRLRAIRRNPTLEGPLFGLGQRLQLHVGFGELGKSDEPVGRGLQIILRQFFGR